MNFIGYTYKADVEEQRSMLVNVLKDLGNISDDEGSPTQGHPSKQHYQQHQAPVQYQQRPGTGNGYQ